MSRVNLKITKENDIRRISILQTIPYPEFLQTLGYLFGPLPDGYVLKYIDEEKDLVSITNERELREAFSSFNGSVLKISVIPPVTEEETDGGPAYHEAYCNHCGVDIYGVRFKCGNCADFDLCETCEAHWSVDFSVHDVTHTFLKIYTPLPDRFTDKMILPQNLYEQEVEEEETRREPPPPPAPRHIDCGGVESDWALREIENAMIAINESQIALRKMSQPENSVEEIEYDDEDCWNRDDEAAEASEEEEEDSAPVEEEEEVDGVEPNDDGIDLDNLEQYSTKVLRQYCNDEGLKTNGSTKKDFIDAIIAYNEYEAPVELKTYNTNVPEEVVDVPEFLDSVDCLPQVDDIDYDAPEERSDISESQESLVELPVLAAFAEAAQSVEDAAAEPVEEPAEESYEEPAYEATSEAIDDAVDEAVAEIVEQEEAPIEEPFEVPAAPDAQPEAEEVDEEPNAVLSFWKKLQSIFSSEVEWRDEWNTLLAQMEDMGFTDKERCKHSLTSHRGNINAAVEALLQD